MNVIVKQIKSKIKTKMLNAVGSDIVGMVGRNFCFQQRKKK